MPAERRGAPKAGLVAALAVAALASPWSGGAAGAQSVLERTPNVEGVWGSRPATLHFHFLHRFQVTSPPVSKVLNSPTFLLAAGIPGRVVVGGRYATNSLLVGGSPNEWEVFGRWAAAPVAAGKLVDLALQGGWNGTAESADGEVLAGAGVGPVHLNAGARGFSAFRGGDPRAAWLAGARLRLHRFVALAGDAARVLGSEAPDLAWSAGLQLEIPYTPHSLSLHVANANTTTLQGSTIGLPERLWGFEFTVPLTLRRYFGPERPPPAAAAGSEGAAPAARRAAAVVDMNNRLQFLPDTVRVKVGEAVLWRNTSEIVHTVTADPAAAARLENVRLPAGAAPFDSGDMPPGAEFSHRFDVPGEYGYVCLPHELAGMVGVVIVEP
ncbi:MAG: hypothetical protein KY466_07390 [Gemmatimonadetes bacterium]|nr:hypothetical protein [Gemmatimonadota bacterium]